MKKVEKKTRIFLGYRAYGAGNKLICETHSYSNLINVVRLANKQMKRIKVVEVYREVHYFRPFEKEIKIDDN